MRSVAVEHEVRVAAVMYGGSSLAIYMNGVAHELLEFVRATSDPDPAADAALTGTARVYRKLARALEISPGSGGHSEPQGGGEDLTVRFLVDILSGTSAGGINAVMLAKALVQNTDLKPLKDLWIEDGALEKLINDRSPGRRVRSLFDSSYMYRKLLDAMRALDAPAPGNDPLVDELSLAITGTDLAGRPVDLRLEDRIAHEYAHRHVFEFHYPADGQHEFAEDHDPLLAFAARSTSSLPAVFEPTVVKELKPLSGTEGAVADWGLLFRDVPASERHEYEEHHAFADGGYLDNKPFGHAIDRLSHAEGGVQVTRKLFYLEPIPGRMKPRSAEVPDALENSLDVVSLARYETIRADIQRIEERNRLVRRLRTLHAGVIEDGLCLTSTPPPQRTEYPKLRELVKPYTYGSAYGGYHRLRVSSVTADLANTVADHLKLPERSRLRTAMQLLARTWRRANYTRDDTSAQRRESAFLADYDLQFHRRRAVFMLDKINQLLELEPQVVAELKNLRGGPGYTEILNVVDALDRDATSRKEALDAWNGIRPKLREAKELAQAAANAIAYGTGQDPLAAKLGELRPEFEKIAGTKLANALLQLLVPNEDADRAKRAGDLLDQRRQLIDAIEGALKQRCLARELEADVKFAALAHLKTSSQLEAELKTLLTCYSEDFVLFDMVQFPVLHDSGVGEELSPVGVHRISATDPGFYGTRFASRDRLLGARHFDMGAFLDERWRKHDIRWGRLDSTERIIGSLLGNDRAAERDALIAEAHLAVVNEELDGELQPEDQSMIDERMRALTGPPASVPSGIVAQTRTDLIGLLDKHEHNLEPDRKLIAHDLSRLARVTDKLLRTLTAKPDAPGGAGAPVRQRGSQESPATQFVRGLLRAVSPFATVALNLAAAGLWVRALFADSHPGQRRTGD